MNNLPLMYTDYANLWHLISSPGEYQTEAEFYTKIFLEKCRFTPKNILELGSGGGNNASYLKKSFQMTLVDISLQMLEVSRKLNPALEHIEGDMRRVRLGRTFDGVFIHDAIMYMTTEEDLYSALQTAAIHCKPNGILVVAPDEVKEIYQPYTDCGGNDDHLDNYDGLSIRYLEWSYDPDPNDNTYTVDFAYMIKDQKNTIHLVKDRHILGIFHRNIWITLLNSAGFDPKIIQDPFERELFIGIRRK